MTTINAVALGLDGATGTGNFVGSTSPTLVTPTLGAATATSVAFSPTTGGIVGTTAADNASAGKVGEFITSNIPSGSAVSLTNTTPANVTSINLTAGDWNVIGNVTFSLSANATQCFCWCSTTSATQPDVSLYALVEPTTNTILGAALTTPFLRVNVNTTTTVYLSCQANFGSGTATACGSIFARRVR